MRSRLAARLAAALLVVALQRSTAWGQYEIVAVSGQAAAGFDGDFSTLLFTRSALNDLGQIAFTGEVTGPSIGVEANRGSWQYSPGGALSLVAREGDPIDGSPGVFASSANSLSQTARGDLALVVPAREGSTPYESLIVLKDGALTEIARSTDPAPGFVEPYTNFGQVFLNESGRVFFNAEPIGSLDAGLWSIPEDGSAGLLAAERRESPDGGANISSINGRSLDRSGRAIMRASFTAAATGTTLQQGLWLEREGGLERFNLEGVSAPGTSSAFGRVTASAQPSDASGDFYFLADLDDPGLSRTVGIWAETGDGEYALRHLFDKSTFLPPGSDVGFDTLQAPVVSGDGALSFYAGLLELGGDGAGIWREDANGDLTLVSKVGDTPPGTDLALRSIDLDFAFNDLRQVAFFGRVREPDKVGPRPQELTGIWAQDPAGELQLIALEGQTIDVGSDPSTPDLRTIASLDFRPNGLNNLGQLAFGAAFTDGSTGLFLSNAVAIPEPSASGLAIAFAIVALRRRSSSAQAVRLAGR